MTPEERAVIKAAVEFARNTTGRGDLGQPIIHAVDAYRKATAPPEPFEAFITYWGEFDGKWSITKYEMRCDPAQVWRCTVTPIERVR